jgi:hypothetical protein
MKSRHIQMTIISAYISNIPISEFGFVSNGALFADGVNSSVAGEAAIGDALFKALIKLTLNRIEETPLNKTMTVLLGLSTGDEVILSRQIGVSVGKDLHGLIVSNKPNTDDVILVNRTSELMYIYLTDSCRHLRAAATLQRYSDQPNLISNEDAALGYGRELNMWAVLAEVARL